MHKALKIKSLSATQQELYIYGDIGEGYWDDEISPKSVIAALNEMPPTTNEIKVRINSPGGDVFAGIAIYNLLKQHDAKIITTVDGLCASIASIIALAGDEVIMGEGALYMIHLPWTMAAGNRIELDNTVQRLFDVEELMLSIYLNRCTKKKKIDRSEIRALLEKETWMDSDQAIEYGFVDSVAQDPAVPIAASSLDKAKWLAKKPPIKTFDSIIKDRAQEIKDKIERFKAR